MSATATAVKTWPTIEAVEECLRALQDAYDKLDRLQGSVRDFVDLEEPWERREHVPVPTLADVGALSRLVDDTEWDLDQFKHLLRQLRRLRSCASTWEPQSRKTEADDAR